MGGLDSLFLGMGIHILAGFYDLQDMIIKVDNIKCNAYINNELLFLNKFKSCIQFHNYLLE